MNIEQEDIFSIPAEELDAAEEEEKELELWILNNEDKCT